MGRVPAPPPAAANATPGARADLVSPMTSHPRYHAVDCRRLVRARADACARAADVCHPGWRCRHHPPAWRL
eukprot:scaffold15885_cov127-Isochrysis_galbana.AAC.7